jgi:hypothetical protein
LLPLFFPEFMIDEKISPGVISVQAVLMFQEILDAADDGRSWSQESSQVGADSLLPLVPEHAVANALAIGKREYGALAGGLPDANNIGFDHIVEPAGS